ncbi:MAG: hypothetical protein R2747_00815 [Pyrinomonadaceae bacterium]
MIVFFLTAGYFTWQNNHKSSDHFNSDNSGLRFELIKSSGNPLAAAISPDGKYIAYINVANGQQSLWLRQLSSGVNTQIVVPESEVTFYHLEFSRNGEYIYFTCDDKTEPVHLDRVSVLGGTVKIHILNEVDGAFSISPDDRLISFRRYGKQKRSLLIANIDGSDVRPIFETTKTFTDNVFSPNGKAIAFANGQSDTGDRDFGIYSIDLESGEVKSVTDFRWLYVRSIIWLPDQSGLLVTARVKNDEPKQLWKISMPGGEVEKITDTQNDFNLISATKDLSKILLTQISLTSNLYLATSFAIDNVQPIVQASEGVTWAVEGNLVYSSPSSGNHDIWMLSKDKTNQKQLTTEDSTDFDPQLSPDGRYIVFISDRGGKYNLWRISADGSDPVRLTNGEGEQNPVFTKDGKFVVFNSMKDVSLWKISVEGGEPTLVSDKRAYNISISPDGAKFAHFAEKDNKLKIVVKSFSDNRILREFAIPERLFAGHDIVWAKDGGSLIYSAENANLVGNLWQQSLNGGSPRKLTNYLSDEIFYFDLAPDSRRFALIRGSWNYDIVLATGFNE